MLVIIWPFVIGGVRRGWLDQAVQDRTMVVYAMQDHPWLGLMKQGMFSDFIAVVGAVKFGLEHGATGVRVAYSNPMYNDPARSPPDNYWEYFFESDITLKDSDKFSTPEETHFNRRLARFGLYGSFR